MDYSLDLYTYRVSCMDSGADKMDKGFSYTKRFRALRRCVSEGGHRSEFNGAEDEIEMESFQQVSSCQQLIKRVLRGAASSVVPVSSSVQEGLSMYTHRQRRTAPSRNQIHRPLPRLSLTPRHRHQRLQWCRTRLSWSDSEWQRVIFSDESRFSLGGDAQRIRVVEGNRGQPPSMDRVCCHTVQKTWCPYTSQHYSTICRELCEAVQACMGWIITVTPVGTLYRSIPRRLRVLGLANTAARRHTERPRNSLKHGSTEQWRILQRPPLEGGDEAAAPMKTRLRRHTEHGTRDTRPRETAGETRSAPTSPLDPVSPTDLSSRPKPAQWTVDQVSSFISNLPGCQDIAESFRAQEIDGQALLLLTEDHLMSAMNVKLGPALKICARINSLKEGGRIGS
ncbi:hypothetical protein NFI96_007872 [Prochilodus magdalenae]|nr:hypothetical protein NFI96_007872 [Prochilodus magdalenae]